MFSYLFHEMIQQLYSMNCSLREVCKHVSYVLASTEKEWVLFLHFFLFVKKVQLEVEFVFSYFIIALFFFLLTL